VNDTQGCVLRNSIAAFFVATIYMGFQLWNVRDNGLFLNPHFLKIPNPQNTNSPQGIELLQKNKEISSLFAKLTSYLD
jgi:hypothetical protein